MENGDNVKMNPALYNFYPFESRLYEIAKKKLNGITQNSYPHEPFYDISEKNCNHLTFEFCNFKILKLQYSYS